MQSANEGNIRENTDETINNASEIKTSEALCWRTLLLESFKKQDPRIQQRISSIIFPLNTEFEITAQILFSDPRNKYTAKYWVNNLILFPLSCNNVADFETQYKFNNREIASHSETFLEQERQNASQCVLFLRQRTTSTNNNMA